MTQVRHHAAKRRIDAREPRHDRCRQTDFAHQRPGMKRASPAKRHRSKAFRIMTPLNRDQANGACHFRIGDANDRLGGLFHRNPERPGNVPVDGGGGRLAVQPCQLVADRVAGVDAAQNQIGVRDGRAVIAKSITDGSRIRPRALRPDIQQAGLVDMGD